MSIPMRQVIFTINQYLPLDIFSNLQWFSSDFYLTQPTKLGLKPLSQIKDQVQYFIPCIWDSITFTIKQLQWHNIFENNSSQKMFKQWNILSNISCYPLPQNVVVSFLFTEENFSPWNYLFDAKIAEKIDYFY